jgi:hypothetical protein
VDDLVRSADGLAKKSKSFTLIASALEDIILGAELRGSDLYGRIKPGGTLKVTGWALQGQVKTKS